MSGKKQNRWRRLLRQSANILKKMTWARNVMFKDASGAELRPERAKEACQVCMLGAMALASDLPVTTGDYYARAFNGETDNKVYNRAVKELQSYFAVRTAYQVNDNSKTKEEVIEKMLAVANKD